MSKLHLRQTNESVSSSPPKRINHGDTTNIPVLDHQTCPHRGQRAFEKPKMRSAAQASRRKPSPKYQRKDEPTSNAIIAAIPTNGTDHFMNVAARNAFRIFECSVRSGRMGRMLCRTIQLTDGGPSETPEFSTGGAGPPFGAAHGCPIGCVCLRTRR